MYLTPLTASPPSSRVHAPASSARETLLIVSIDTEEDNWIPARENVTVDNIRELPRFQLALERMGVRATYFVSYQVLRARWAADILRGCAPAAELAAHLHPWNTPPLEPLRRGSSMLGNLLPEIQLAKLRQLTEAFGTAFGWAPTAFRAGRWGIASSTLAALSACGYRIDSSVTPFMSWEAYDDGPSHDGAPPGAYGLGDGGDVRIPTRGKPKLWEIPATFGYSRRPFQRWHRVHRALMSPIGRRLRLPGIAWRTNLIRKVTLSPETNATAELLTLSRRALEDGAPYLHLFLHSPSLVPGLTPFVRTREEAMRFRASIERYLEGLSAFTTVRPVTISEAADALGLPQQSAK